LQAIYGNQSRVTLRQLSIHGQETFSNTTSYDFDLDSLASKPVSIKTGWNNILPANSRSNDSVLIFKINAKAENSTKAYTSEIFWVPKYIRNFTFMVQDAGEDGKWKEGVTVKNLWNNLEVSVWG
jgi:hypothetical protein